VLALWLFSVFFYLPLLYCATCQAFLDLSRRWRSTLSADSARSVHRMRSKVLRLRNTARPGSHASERDRLQRLEGRFRKCLGVPVGSVCFYRLRNTSVKSISRARCSAVGVLPSRVCEYPNYFVHCFLLANSFLFAVQFDFFFYEKTTPSFLLMAACVNVRKVSLSCHQTLVRARCSNLARVRTSTGFSVQSRGVDTHDGNCVDCLLLPLGPAAVDISTCTRIFAYFSSPSYT